MINQTRTTVKHFLKVCLNAKDQEKKKKKLVYPRLYSDSSTRPHESFYLAHQFKFSARYNFQQNQCDLYRIDHPPHKSHTHFLEVNDSEKKCLQHFGYKIDVGTLTFIDNSTQGTLYENRCVKCCGDKKTLLF